MEKIFVTCVIKNISIQHIKYSCNQQEKGNQFSFKCGQLNISKYLNEKETHMYNKHTKNDKLH